MVIVAKKTIAGERFEGIDRLAEGEPGQGSAGDQRRRRLQRISLGVFFQKKQARAVQLVPYRGAASGHQDLMAGQIELMIDAAAKSLAACS